MLTKKTQVVIEAKSEVDGKAIMGFRAIIEVGDECKMIKHPYDIDPVAAKEHRKIVREDQAAFEDYAYEVQEKLLEEVNK